MKTITSNANINSGNFHHDIVEQNRKKANIQRQLYLPYVQQEPKQLKINKSSNINVDNIPCKLFYCEAVFSLWKANIECCLFLTPLLS